MFSILNYVQLLEFCDVLCEGDELEDGGEGFPLKGAVQGRYQDNLCSKMG